MALNTFLKTFTAGVAVTQLLNIPGSTARKPGLDEFMKPDVSVLVVKEGVTNGYKSTEQIMSGFEDVNRALEYSTGGMRRLGEISFREVVVPPLGEKLLWGENRACYTDEQFNDLQDSIREQPRTFGGKIIKVVVYNGGFSCDKNVAGRAILDASNPRIMLNLVLQKDNKKTELHEIGHLLGPSAKGLGHEAVLGCWKYDRNGMPYKTYSNTATTVQELISDGCGLSKMPNGEVDWYASKTSVMGIDPKSFGGEDFPSFSPPELPRLNPRLRTQEIEAKPGKYYLSYKQGELFGVRLRLPEGHVLQKIIPDAESLYIGPVITGWLSGNEHTLESQGDFVNMGVFVETSDTYNLLNIPNDMPNGFRPTVELAPYLPQDLPPVSIAGIQQESDFDRVVVYADAELGERGIAVVAGTDTEGRYVQVLALDDPVAVALNKRRLAYTQKVNEIRRG